MTANWKQWIHREKAGNISFLMTNIYTRLPRKYAVDTPPGSVISLYCGFCEAAKAVPAEAIRAETR